MFKLQLVLVGLLFSISMLNAVLAAKELEFKVKLQDATLKFTLIDTGNDNIPIDFKPEKDKYIEKDSTQRTTINPDSFYSTNPEEGNYTEGDLLYSGVVASELVPEYMDSFNNQKHNTADAENKSNPDDESLDLLMPTGTAVRTALLATNSYWPGGLVPYQLNGSFTRDQIRPLLYAFDQFATKTCVRFYPRTNEEDYVSIQKTTSGCASDVGRMGGKQIFILAPNCFHHGIIMHELMHVLGFLHEQNRYDRDNYIKVLYENIKKGHDKDYKKFSKNETNNLGVPYDYGSIMHYRAQSFSKNDNPTIVALRQIPKDVRMGQREGFSKYDLAKIHLRYRCSDSELYQKVRRILS